MADTIRTRDQILALFADNTSGDISAQKIRDAIVSLFGVYGIIKAVGNSTVQAMAVATPAKLVNYTKDGLSVGVTADFGNGQIILPNGGTYIFVAQASIKSSVANVSLQVRLALDDVPIDGRFDLDLETADKSDSSVCFDIVVANAAQVLSLRAETDKITDLTMKDSQLIAVRIG